MAVETERKKQRGWGELTPEEKLLRAIFGKNAETSRVEPQDAEDDFAGDRALLSAMDAISDSLEANIGRWNSALDLIEEDLSRAMASRREVEAAAP